MNDKQHLKSLAENVIQGAAKRGAKNARVVASQSNDLSVAYRKGRADTVQQSQRKGIALQLFMGGRYASCTTNDLRGEALDRFLDNAVEMCKATAPDECRALPEPELYAGRNGDDLQLFDGSVERYPAERCHKYAAELEAVTLDKAGPNAISAEANVSRYSSQAYQMHTNGFEGERHSTMLGASASLSLNDEGDKRPGGWGSAAVRFAADMVEPDDIARRAVEAVKSRLGTSKIPTEKLPMVVENRAAGRLVGYLLGAASGRAIQQKTSFLADKIGKPIGSKLLDLTDNPFITRGLGSRRFDTEGIAAKKFLFIEGGVLKNIYVGTYYGRKLDMTPTCGSTSNLVMTVGEKDLDGLCADLDRGVLVRGFIGGNSNPTTGDFSIGVYGTLIEKGKLTDAVAEMNIAGNHAELWQQLAAVGNDPYPYSSLQLPSMTFDGVQFSGD